MFKKLAVAAFMVFGMACGGGGGGSEFSCTTSSGGTQACAEYKGFTGAEKSAEDTACKNAGGTAGSGCPTASLVGCCTETSAGVGSEACYYTGTAADLQSACTSSSGTWATTP